jgi:hypothetical protein
MDEMPPGWSGCVYMYMIDGWTCMLNSHQADRCIPRFAYPEHRLITPERHLSDLFWKRSWPLDHG